jgi:hypothetical protein
VSLRAPAPLERELALEHAADGVVLLRDGEATLAEGRSTTLELDVPPPVTLRDAEAAVAGYFGFKRHPFPTCFGCGPDCEDGLRLFPGPVDGRDVVACPWLPANELADEGGAVKAEFVWAALDCPTAFACDLTGPPMVLARLTGRIDGSVRAGKPHVVTAWYLQRDGRKHHSACVIATAEGQPLAVAQALWIELTDPSAFGV